MPRKRKNNFEIKFKCPECGKYAEPNKESTENFAHYDMVYPDCKVRYDWEYYNNGEKI